MKKKLTQSREGNQTRIEKCEGSYKGLRLVGDWDNGTLGLPIPLRGREFLRLLRL